MIESLNNWATCLKRLHEVFNCPRDWNGIEKLYAILSPFLIDEDETKLNELYEENFKDNKTLEAFLKEFIKADADYGPGITIRMFALWHESFREDIAYLSGNRVLPTDALLTWPVKRKINSKFLEPKEFEFGMLFRRNNRCQIRDKSSKLSVEYASVFEAAFDGWAID